jgi:hypothetical protein
MDKRGDGRPLNGHNRNTEPQAQVVAGKGVAMILKKIARDGNFQRYFFGSRAFKYVNGISCNGGTPIHELAHS